MLNATKSAGSLETILQKACALKGDASFDGDLDYQSPPIPITAQAAVLILIKLSAEPTIILTQRQGHMRKHAGQVAFPGGRKDDTDMDLWATALREANEEIGLPLDHPITRIGTLDKHHTITGFEVEPCLATTNTNFEYTPEAGEVAHIFEIPYRPLLLISSKLKAMNIKDISVTIMFSLIAIISYGAQRRVCCKT